MREWGRYCGVYCKDVTTILPRFYSRRLGVYNTVLLHRVPLAGMVVQKAMEMTIFAYEIIINTNITNMYAY